MRYLYTLIGFLYVGCLPLLSQKLDSNYVDGEVYVKIKSLFNPNLVKTSAAVNLSEELPFLSKFSTKYPLAGVAQSFYFARSLSIRQVYRVRLADPRLVRKFIEDLSREADVVYAEQVPLMRIQLVPNDPFLTTQQYALNRIAAYDAWNVSQGNTLIRVAICDNAIDTNHPDLVGNLLPGYDVANGDNNPNPPDVSMNHGTHVAGIVGAVTNNNIGIASLGFNKIKLIPVKSTLDNAGSSSITHAYEGVIWASQNGANVINTSWGGGAFSQTSQDIANDVFSRGIIWVASAGNSSSTSPSYPAAYNNVISVVSTNATDTRSSFSNYGTSVDLCAPGESIYSTLPANNYASFSGTSMASPLAASVFAYVWSINPSLTATQLIDLVKSTCDNINAQNPGASGLLGSGRVNALRAALQACPNAPAVAITPGGSQVICQGASLTLTATTIQNGVYQWTKDNLLVGTNSSSLVINETGVYGVSVQSADGCPSSATAVNVTVVPQALLITSSKQPVLCNADSVVLTVPVAGMLVEWRRNGTLLGTITNRYVARSSGTYTALLTQPGLVCSVISDPLVVESVSVNTQVMALGSTQLCPAQRVDLQVAPVPGASYQWRKDASFVGSNSNVLTVSLSGQYGVIVTSGFCSFTSAQTQVTVMPATLGLSTTRPVTFCPGDSTGLRTTVVPGLVYAWRRDGASLTGANSASLTARLAGSYTVEAAFSSCSVVSPALVVTVPIYRVTVASAAQNIGCSGTTVSLSALVSPTPVGASYQWFSGANPVSGATSSVYSTTQSGNYSVSTRATNCVAQSVPYSMQFYTVRAATPTVQNALICGADLSAGISGTLTATAGSCPVSLTQVATYNGGTVGYDGGYRSGPDPSVTFTNMPVWSALEVSITWEKKDGEIETSCAMAAGTGTPYNSETQFKLMSPQGTIITLIAGNYLAGNYGGVVTTVFKDGAPGIPIGSEPASGTFSPYQPLSSFSGESATGVWTLLPTDLVTYDPLCVSGFSIRAVLADNNSSVPAISWWDAPTEGRLLGTGTVYQTPPSSSTVQTAYAQSSCIGSCFSTRVAATLTYATMRSVKSGNWTDPTTWTCGRVPTSNDVVHIESGHMVTMNQTVQRAKRLVQRGGRIQLPNNTALRVGQ